MTTAWARRRAAVAISLFLLAPAFARAEEPTETIVLVRHGEKPAAGLGQLNCQGLNRALALPGVIAKTFGKPDAIFAPDPAIQKLDSGKPYDYVRPLATIEPTAIRFGLPIDASLGLEDTDKLAELLDQPGYRSALVLVAWEHRLIDVLARKIVTAHGGNASLVPKWRDDDFDGIYVIKISHGASSGTVSFARLQEGLDGQPLSCQP